MIIVIVIINILHGHLMHTLNMSDMALKICIVVMYVTFDLKTVFHTSSLVMLVYEVSNVAFPKRKAQTFLARP